MVKTTPPVETHMVPTSFLNVEVEVSGPKDGAPLFLLHGWPDSLRTWDDCLAPLHAGGLRTYVPSLRGYGETRFRAPGTFRSGQLSALASDLLELANVLDLQSFSVIGHDWGARAAYIASYLAPERVNACVAISVGWGTNAPDQALPLQQVQNYWYHWYMALDRGAALVQEERKAFTRYIWDIWNPGWKITDEAFEITAAAFDNPDWAEVVLHSYRVRWGLAAMDPTYDPIERELAEGRKITVPTLVLHGGADPCNDPATSEGKEPLFGSRYEREVLDGVGHFPQRQVPGEVARMSEAFLRSTATA